MNSVRQWENLFELAGDINLELSRRLPEKLPLIDRVGKRADLRVHSLNPIITSTYDLRANESLELNEEYKLAAIQVVEDRGRL